VFVLRPHRRPRSTLFPYTTLFRSFHLRSPRASETKLATVTGALSSNSVQVKVPLMSLVSTSSFATSGPLPLTPLTASASGTGGRSEEHTSELQSQSNLVCRLLLEK